MGHWTDLVAQYPHRARPITALAALGKLCKVQQLLGSWHLLHERSSESGKGVSAATQPYLSYDTRKVADIAQQLNLSPKQVERQFVQEVGVRAKSLARPIRFEEVHNRIWKTPDARLAALACDLGFSKHT